MGLLAKVGSLGVNTSTGTQSITGVGFQPKSLLGFLTNDPDVGWVDINPVQMNEGVAISSTQRAAYTASMVNATASSANYRRGFKDDRWMTSVKQITSTEAAGVDLTSMDSDGFTCNVVTAPSASLLALYAAIGGSDITDAAVITAEAQQTPGNFDYTTVGFQPDLVIMMLNGRVAPGYGTGGGFMLGAFDNTGDQLVVWGKDLTGTVPSDCSRVLLNDHCWFAQTPSGGNTVSATFVSMLSNGFRLNFDAITDSQDATALCLKGTFKHKLKVFNKTTATAPAVQDVDCGFPPKFVLLSSAQRTTGTTQIDHNRIGLGVMDGTNQCSYCWTEEDQANPTNVRAYTSNTKAFIKSDNATGTIDASCDHSFSGNNLHLTWDVNDSVATELAMVALGSSSSTIGPPQAAQII